MAKKSNAGDNVVGDTKATIEVVHEKSKAVISESAVEENLGYEVFKTTPAVVSMKKGRTINMGDFESVRIDVGISLPCYAEHIDDAYALADSWINERLGKEVTAVEEASPRHQRARKSNSNNYNASNSNPF
jgi:hypothetical protein